VVYAELGLKDESEAFFEAYRTYAENDPSIYKHINLAFYYSYMNDQEKAIENLKLFSEKQHYHYWTLIFTPIDPLVDNIKDLPEFKKTFNKIEDKFWDWNKQMRASLEEEALI
jgi:hypothetical protein